MRLPTGKLVRPTAPTFGDAISRTALHVGLSFMLLTNAVQPPPAIAYTAFSDEQKIVAEAWKVADREYVNRDFNGQDWFTTRQKLVRQKYADKEAAYAEIRKMLGSLGDKYTRFLTPAMFDAVYSVATGDVAGMGVELQAFPRGGKDVEPAAGGPTDVTINSVVEGSPAEKAGLKQGDVIEEVDGENVRSLSAEEAASRVRGAIGSKMRLVARREGQEEPITRVIERASVKLEGVSNLGVSTIGGTKVGLTRMKQFSTTTAADVQNALEAQAKQGAQAFVLDLRGNTGGYFTGGIDVARLFLPKDAIINYVTDKKQNVVTYQAYEDGAYLSQKLVVLVDGKTASASEILSSALQDNGRATLVGSQTFGKAVIQTVEKLEDGSAVVVTIARYETPKHTDINKQGITPNVVKECPPPTPASECLPPKLV